MPELCESRHLQRRRSGNVQHDILGSDIDHIDECLDINDIDFDINSVECLISNERVIESIVKLIEHLANTRHILYYDSGYELLVSRFFVGGDHLVGILDDRNRGYPYSPPS